MCFLCRFVLYDILDVFLNNIVFVHFFWIMLPQWQADCVESRSRGDVVFSSMMKPKEFEFKRMQHVTLEPFDRDRAYVFGAFRMIEVSLL